MLFDRFMMEEQFGWRVAENCPNALRILDTEDLHFLRKTRHQQLKKLLQQAQVPTWQRASLPYLFIEGELVAVGDFLRADSLVSAGITITCEESLSKKSHKLP